MKAYLHRRYRFSASHRLHAESLDEQRNREVYGKCNNPFGHGHNYEVEVTVSGPVNAVTGMVMDIGELENHLATLRLAPDGTVSHPPIVHEPCRSLSCVIEIRRNSMSVPICVADFIVICQ